MDIEKKKQIEVYVGFADGVTAQAVGDIMKHTCIILYSLFAVATPVYAHGEEVIFGPVGQILALVANVLIINLVLRSVPEFRRWFGLLTAVVVCIPIWFIPGNYFPEYLRYSGWGNFVIGLLPPILVGGAVSFAVKFTNSQK